MKQIVKVCIKPQVKHPSIVEDVTNLINTINKVCEWEKDSLFPRNNPFDIRKLFYKQDNHNVLYGWEFKFPLNSKYPSPTRMAFNDIFYGDTLTSHFDFYVTIQKDEWDK